jgi:hypothetical protein
MEARLKVDGWFEINKLLFVLVLVENRVDCKNGLVIPEYWSYDDTD